jgi:3-hydroxyisobutyrate dehydrogenase-like beta-hydroxyacid dehydrogenase
MSQPIVIDRIEGNRAVLVVGDETVDIPVSALPPGAGEGSVLVLSLGDDSALRAAAEARQARMAAASNLPDEIDL